MKKYHIGFLYIIFVLGSLTIIYFDNENKDYSDCRIYLNDDWNLTPEEIKQLAYNECLETPFNERDDYRHSGLWILTVALLPSSIIIGIKSHSEWKKEIDVKRRMK